MFFRLSIALCAMFGWTTVALAAPTLNYRCLAEGLSGSWDDKGGRASSYRSGCCEYRMYRPDTSRTSGGGLYVTFQMDHNRRMARDDHAVIRMWFDSDAILQKSDVQVEIAGEVSFNVKTGDPEVDAATKIGNEIYQFVQSLGGAKSAGRLYFSSDIQQNVNRVDQCTRNW